MEDSKQPGRMPRVDPCPEPKKAAYAPSSKDAWLDVASIDDIGSWIKRAVNDPCLVERVVRRVATAIHDNNEIRGEAKRLIPYIAERRRQGTIKSPGRYFVTCAMGWFEAEGIPWSTAGD